MWHAGYIQQIKENFNGNRIPLILNNKTSCLETFLLEMLSEFNRNFVHSRCVLYVFYFLFPDAAIYLFITVYMYIVWVRHLYIECDVSVFVQKCDASFNPLRLSKTLIVTIQLN